MGWKYFAIYRSFHKELYEKSKEGYILEVQYPPKLYELHSDLPFLPARKKLGKVEKLVTNLQDKTEYGVHIRNIKKH